MFAMQWMERKKANRFIHKRDETGLQAGRERKIVQSLLLHAFRGANNGQMERENVCRYKSQGTRDRKLFFNLIIINSLCLWHCPSRFRVRAFWACINALPIITARRLSHVQRVHMITPLFSAKWASAQISRLFIFRSAFKNKLVACALRRQWKELQRPQTMTIRKTFL